jgi:hypothetical protein
MGVNKIGLVDYSEKNKLFEIKKNMKWAGGVIKA